MEAAPSSTTARDAPRGGQPGLRDEDAFQAALEEARTQAEALRRSLNEVEAVIRACRDLLDCLRAILVHPTAYQWPGEHVASVWPDCDEPGPLAEEFPADRKPA